MITKWQLKTDDFLLFVVWPTTSWTLWKVSIGMVSLRWTRRGPELGEGY